MARGAPRGTRADSAADELSPQSKRPRVAGAERTPPESVPVLRRRHDDDGRHRRVGRPAGERRRLARGAASGGASGLAEREQRGQPGRAPADRRGV